MIFACGKCRTRYKLPDEKVAGRVLRVRCKACGAVIHVRDPALPASSTPATPAAEAEWFVAVRGRQHGPMTLASLVSLAQDGTISEDNYAWREGMEAWLKIADIQVLERLLAAASAPPVPPVVVPPPEDAQEATTRPQEAAPAAAAESDGPAPEPESIAPVDPAIAPVAPESSATPEAIASEVKPMEVAASGASAPAAPSEAATAVEQAEASSVEATEVALLDAPEAESTPAEDPEADIMTREEDAATVPLKEGAGSDSAAVEAPVSPAARATDPEERSTEEPSEPSEPDEEPVDVPKVAQETPEGAARPELATQTVEVPAATESPSIIAPAEVPTSEVGKASAAMFAAMSTRPADSQAKTVEDPTPKRSDASGEIRFAEDQSKTVEDPMAAMREAIPAIEEVVQPEGLSTTQEDLLVELMEVEALDSTGEVPELPDLPYAPIDEVVPELPDEPTEAVIPELPGEPSDQTSASEDEGELAAPEGASPQALSHAEPSEPAEPEVTDATSQVADQGDQVDPASASEAEQGVAEQTQGAPDDLSPEVAPEAPVASEVAPEAPVASDEQATPEAPESVSKPAPSDGLDDVDAWFNEVPGWSKDKPKAADAPPIGERPPRNKAGVLDSQTQLEAILGQSMKYAGKASKTDKAMLKKALEGAPELDVLSAIDAPSRSELKTLRKEFSVVEKLEANTRKRAMIVAVAATALIGLGVGAVVLNGAMQDSAEQPDYGPSKAAPEVKRALYEVPSEEVMPAAPGGVMNRRQGGDVQPLPDKAAPKKAAASPAKAKVTSKKKVASSGTAKAAKSGGEPRVAKKAKKEAERAGKVKKMSAREFSQLSAAKGGKAEIKLPTASKTLSDIRKKKAEKKGLTTFSDRAKKITGIIGKKRRLLAQCKSDQDEKVKVTFTIALTGKVTSVRIKGTKNERKKSCIANVFWRSIFPKGETSETFSLPFTI